MINEIHTETEAIEHYILTNVDISSLPTNSFHNFSSDLKTKKNVLIQISYSGFNANNAVIKLQFSGNGNNDTFHYLPGAEVVLNQSETVQYIEWEDFNGGFLRIELNKGSVTTGIISIYVLSKIY